MKQVLFPVLIGAAVALAAYALDPFAGPAPKDQDPNLAAAGPLAGSQTPFASFVLPADLVFVSDAGRLPGAGTGLAGNGTAYSIHNGTSFVTLARIQQTGELCDGPCGLGLEALVPEGPRLGINSTLASLSVYVFDDVGSLLGTNTNDTRFGSPSIRLPLGPWYFGTGEAPAQSVSVRQVGGALLASYAELLMGASEGTVVSARVADHPFAGQIGPIYVTARVDALHVTTEPAA